jgi:hypothetical protein
MFVAPIPHIALRRRTLRHDPGLAASPGVRDTLGEKGMSPACSRMHVDETAGVLLGAQVPPSLTVHLP